MRVSVSTSWATTEADVEFSALRHHLAHRPRVPRLPERSLQKRNGSATASAAVSDVGGLYVGELLERGKDRCGRQTIVPQVRASSSHKAHTETP